MPEVVAFCERRLWTKARDAPRAAPAGRPAGGGGRRDASARAPRLAAELPEPRLHHRDGARVGAAAPRHVSGGGRKAVQLANAFSPKYAARQWDGNRGPALQSVATGVRRTITERETSLDYRGESAVPPCAAPLGPSALARTSSTIELRRAAPPEKRRSTAVLRRRPAEHIRTQTWLAPTPRNAHHWSNRLNPREQARPTARDLRALPPAAALIIGGS